MAIKRLLLTSNLLTLALLVVLAQHYRVPQKLWRAWVVEGRAPAITPPHALNRNYQSSRELFRSYRKSDNPILIFGDSHVRLISWNELLGRNDVANRGIDGDTLAGVSARFADEADANPAAVVILAGTNDLVRGTGLNEMRDSMEKLLTEADRLWPGIPLLIASVAPVAHWQENHHRINARAHAFNQWLSNRLASIPHARFIDLHIALADPHGHLVPSMTTDGVHLSSKAYLACRSLLEAHLPRPSKPER